MDHHPYSRAASVVWMLEEVGIARAGSLAPPLDAPERGTYLRWSPFAPSRRARRDGEDAGVDYMLTFKMIEPRPAFTAYAEGLSARPALQRAEARNAAIAKEHGLGD